MYITGITVSGFRNLKEIDITPGKNFNIIYGQNAQGKTNLLEALWISTGCRSFRSTKERDYLVRTIERMKISARAYDKVLRVARTLADLDGSEAGREGDILNAVTYRKLDSEDNAFWV